MWIHIDNINKYQKHIINPYTILSTSSNKKIINQIQNNKTIIVAQSLRTRLITLYSKPMYHVSI